MLGFNGEFTGPGYRQYPLGAGYRFLDTETRQFNAPDSESPFGVGGPHAYGYCTNGDPINSYDPSGHQDISRAIARARGGYHEHPAAGLGKDGALVHTILFTGIGVLLAPMTGGASMLFAVAFTALAVVSAALIITSVVIADSNPGLSEGLAWAGLVFGVAGGAWSMGSRILQSAARFARHLGNTARFVGKSIFNRTAFLANARQALQKGFGPMPKNVSTSLFNSNRVLTALPNIVGDLNTLVFGITGALANLRTFEENENANFINTLMGDLSYLPHGNWMKIFASLRIR